MKKDNMKKSIIIAIIVAVLVLTIGGTFALWTYFKIGGNQVLIAGDIYMKYTGVNNLSVTNAVPSDTYNKNDYFEFTVEGNNTYANDIIYDIVLHHGDKPEDANRTERIRDDLLNFRLVKVNNAETGETEEELIQEGNYESIEEKRIWVDTIAGKTKEKVSVKYRLYVWVSNKIKIGLGDNIDYDTDTWNSKVYASIKVSVTGDFNDKPLDGEIDEDTDLVNIKYTNLDNVTITNDNKVDIGSYYRNIVNPNMNSEELSDCIRIFNKLNDDNEGKWFTSSESAKNYCEGTGTSNGKTFQHNVDYKFFDRRSWLSDDSFLRGLKVKNIVIEKFDSNTSISKYSFKVNTDSDPSIQQACMDYFSLAEFEGWFKETESASAYCEGTGTSNDSTFQHDLDNAGMTEMQLLYLLNNNIIVENESKNETELSAIPYLEFTVEKKTEKINKNIWYEIILKRDDSSEIDDSLLNFNLVKVENSKETLLLSNYSSNDLSNDKIYVDIANSNVEKITYRLYMWLPTNIEYTLSSPVSVKVEVISKVVNNPLEETVLQNGKATDVIKSTINIPGGVIGITNDNKKIRTTSDDIREYRYSGFFANNYIKFNNELWRIVGIFKDENGQELLKIVRNDVINGNKFPEDYQVSEETYNLKYSAEKYNILNENYVYYNRKSGENIKREWSTSAIQYWLNSKGTGDIGYLDSIAESSRKMIQETKYYLGNITDATNGIEDTPIQAYANERKSVQCEVTSKSHEQNPPCYIWPGFQATWTGKIGLMYPSDFGFSADSQYWNNQLNYKNFTIPSYSSWFNSLSNKGLEFLISPTSDSDNSAAMLRNVNYMSLGGVVDYIRPTLYLKNNVEIILGNGTKESPYEVKCTSCTN